MSRINVANFRHPDGTSDNINLTDTGRVGINTSSPSAFLHVQNGEIVKDQDSSQSSANPGFQIKHNGTINGSWRHDGRLEIGGQDANANVRLDTDGIKFNGDTAAANALDDYEEGTWTPSLSFSGGVTSITYDYQNGRYLKIGNLVHYYGYLAVNTFSGASGQVRLSGFPHGARNATATYHAPALGWYSGLATTSYGLGLDIAPNTSSHAIVRGNGTGTSNLGAGDINTNFAIEWSFTIDVN